MIISVWLLLTLPPEMPGEGHSLSPSSRGHRSLLTAQLTQLSLGISDLASDKNCIEVNTRNTGVTSLTDGPHRYVNISLALPRP